MLLTALTVWVPASSKTEGEYEDAYYPHESAQPGGSVGHVRFCMADGASMSGSSQKWARLLVEQWGANSEILTVESLHDAAVAQWQDWRAAQRTTTSAEVGASDWFQAAFPEDDHAHAALAFLQVFLGTYPVWLAWGVGDTYVFHVRNSVRQNSWPPEATGTPTLLSTHAKALGKRALGMSMADGKLEAGDEFFLSTDALGRWIHATSDVGDEPWDTLRTCVQGGRQVFAERVAELRARRPPVIEDDDTTLMWVRVDA